MWLERHNLLSFPSTLGGNQVDSTAVSWYWWGMVAEPQDLILEGPSSLAKGTGSPYFEAGAGPITWSPWLQSHRLGTKKDLRSKIISKLILHYKVYWKGGKIHKQIKHSANQTAAWAPGWVIWATATACGVRVPHPQAASGLRVGGDTRMRKELSKITCSTCLMCKCKKWGPKGFLKIAKERV